MKAFIVFSLLLLAFYLVGFYKDVLSEWLDQKSTTALKGFSILTVVWAHVGAALAVGGIQFIAGIGVAIFLITSGFGLEMSYRKSGLKNFWSKRLLKVLLPFLFVELIGLVVTGNFKLSVFLKDILLIEPATAYGWYIGYIVVCYFLFYATKKWIASKSLVTIFIAFAIWFVMDSLFLANPGIPFLRARQMLCFPLGIWLADNKKLIEEKMSIKSFAILIFAGGGIAGVTFMAVTQFPMIKNLPYIMSNTLSLFTVLPLAIAVIVASKVFGRLFDNYLLLIAGEISYEIYLVHAFTLNLVEESVDKLLIFMMITTILSVVMHCVLKKGLVKKSD